MARQARPATPKSKRAPGRPHAAGAPDAREAIIKAARLLLETRLPAQVTNSMIAREAGADPALIRYYFGDRASLLMAVVKELMASVGQPPPAGTATADDILRERVAATLRLARTTRSMQRIMLDELAESDEQWVRDEVRRWNRHAVQYFSDMLDSKAAEDIVATNPLFLHVAILGLCEFFTSAQAIVRPLADPALSSDDLAAQYEEFVGDLLLNGLRRR